MHSGGMTLRIGNRGIMIVLINFEINNYTSFFSSIKMLFDHHI